MIPITVVLDTCAIEANNNPNSLDWQLFRIWRKRNNVHVSIPEVAMSELKRHFRENLSLRAREIEKFAFARTSTWESISFAKLKIIERAAIDQTSISKLITERSDELLNELLSALFGCEFEILPIPNLTQGELFYKYSAGRFPYRKGNFADTLLWETILDLASKKKSKILFISSNTAEFAQAGSEPPALHENLVDDLTLLDLTENETGVAYHLSIDKLVATQFPERKADSIAENHFVVNRFKALQQILIDDQSKIFQEIKTNLKNISFKTKRNFSHLQAELGYEFLSSKTVSLRPTTVPRAVGVESIEKVSDRDTLITMSLAIGVEADLRQRFFAPENPGSKLSITTSKKTALMARMSLLMETKSHTALAYKLLSAEEIRCTELEIEVMKNGNDQVSVIAKRVGTNARSYLQPGIDKKTAKVLLRYFGVDENKLSKSSKIVGIYHTRSCPQIVFEELISQLYAAEQGDTPEGS